ncbi:MULTISPECIES: cyclic nucleotide-binding domain-containing protein [Anaeromyxobacter]|uniref:cyclic nucleotide-binding domain-containing protein n=1 Tax=Anaeromyxobacter TaxID=161492 RepID=UPI001F5A5B36|nr:MULTISPECIES: cyclic nucleotide-binding domain-containing protein [unclassified Anaeromyxobacter]
MTAFEALRRAALFKDFTETGLRIFAGIALEKAIPAGTPLFVENMVGESLFIVKSGTVRVTQRTPEGEKELAVLGAGEHLGELALLGRSVRLVSAVAGTACEVVEITQRDFVRLQPQKPQACLKLALAIGGDLAEKVAENRDALRELAARRMS